MTLPACPWWLDVEQIGAVTVARFTQRDLLDEKAGFALGKYLLALADEGNPRIVLNFGQVEYLDSMIVGKLLALHKKLTQVDGRLALCRISPQLFELFDLLRLPLMLPMFKEEQEALDALELPYPLRPGLAVAAPAPEAVPATGDRGMLKAVGDPVATF